MPLSGVIFDLDGTLANTLPICYTAFRHALLEYTGRTYTTPEITAMFGPSEEGVFLRMTPEQAEEALQSYLQEYERAHQSLRAPFHGILDALQLLNEHAIRVAVVTGKGPRSAAISLRMLDLASHFDILEAGSPQGVIKPQAIGKVLAQWQLPPSQVAYVGDATADVTSARQAGVVPLAAAWADTADYDALQAMGPQKTFRTVQDFIAWVQSEVEATDERSRLPGPASQRR